MLNRNALVTMLLLAVFVILGVAASHKPVTEFKNLKVLPLDITAPKLDSIMHSYTIALGATCNFCHVSYKENADSLNYASDEDPMKDNARDMMRMTISVNKTWFYFDKAKQPEYLNTVSCITCHRGQPFPDK